MTANPQKLKTLYLLRMLQEETDPDHGLTMNEILDRLAELGISAERKSLYRDIQALNDFGVNVTKLSTSPVQYALVDKPLTRDDVMLLVDAVQSCRFLSQAESDRLVSALRQLVSVRQRDLLNKQVHVEDRVTGRGEVAFRNVDVIHQAIQQRRKITFCNAKLDAEGNTQLTHDGKRYSVTPVALAFAEGFYYLTAFSDDENDFRKFRVDRMRLLTVSDEAATRNARIANYVFENQGYKAFHGLSGKPVTVTLRVKDGFMDVMADTFGADLAPRKASNGDALVRVNVQESTQFYGWLAGISVGITPESPAGFVTRYREWLASLC